MTEVYLITASVLLLTILGSVIRVARGPDPADRIAAAQLIGTTGIALVLVIGAASPGSGGATDVAILLALLAALGATAFARLSVAYLVDEPHETVPPDDPSPGGQP